MLLTPVEIRHVELRRSLFRGYKRSDIDRLIDDIASSFEEVWRERADLSDRVEEMESDAAKHKELESLLRSTLVSAERAAQDMKEQARREADLVVQEAHAEGRRVTRESAAEKRRLEEEIRRIRGQLHSALEALGDAAQEPREDATEQTVAPPRPAALEEISESGIRKVVG